MVGKLRDGVFKSTDISFFKTIYFLFIIYFLLFNFSGKLFAKKEVFVLKARESIVLDGCFKEDSWNKIKWYSDFKVLNSKDSPSQSTTFAVIYDEKNIYVGIRCKESELAELKAIEKLHDGKVWRDDSVELFLSYMSFDNLTSHFVINTIGTRYESRYLTHNGPTTPTVNWNIPWEAAIAKDKKEWRVEVSIPWYAFVEGNSYPSNWKIQVGRERYAGKRELSAYPQAQGGFGYVTDFADLKGIDVDFSPYSFSLIPPQIVTLLKGDKLRVQVKTILTNFKSLTSSVIVEARLKDSKGYSKLLREKVLVPKRENIEIVFPFELPSTGGDYKVILVVQSSNPPFKIFHYKESAISFQYVPIKITLYKPIYRTDIFDTQPEKEISFIINKNSDDKNDKIVLTLKNNKNNKIIYSNEIIGPSRKIEWDMAELSYGKYVLQAKLINENGELKGKDQIIIRKLPPAQGSEVWLDERGFTHLNGKLFFPHGFFNVPVEDFPLLKKAGFNVILFYQIGKSFEDWKKYLDFALNNGLYVVAYPYPSIDYIRPHSSAKNLTVKQKETLKQWVRERKDHPALLAWYAADEPEMRGIFPEYLKDIYNTLKEEDPYHPIIVLNNTLEGISHYKDSADILMPDPYPGFYPGVKIRNPTRIRDFLKEVQKQRKTAWVTPQAFAYSNTAANKDGRINDIAPSFDQARWQVYQSIIYKARGIIWYSFRTTRMLPQRRIFYFYEYPELCWGMFKGLAPELKVLSEYILQSNEDKFIQIEPSNIMSARLFDTSRGIIILCQNMSKKIQKVTFKIPFKKFNKLYVIAENRSITSTSSNFFSDEFNAYSAHGYSTFKIEGLKSIEEIKQEFINGERINRP